MQARLHTSFESVKATRTLCIPEPELTSGLHACPY